MKISRSLYGKISLMATILRLELLTLTLISLTFVSSFLSSKDIFSVETHLYVVCAE